MRHERTRSNCIQSKFQQVDKERNTMNRMISNHFTFFIYFLRTFPRLKYFLNLKSGLE